MRCIILYPPPEQKKNLRYENKTCTMRSLSFGRPRATRENEPWVKSCGLEGVSVDKTKALDAALYPEIERAFGKGSIMRLGKGEKPVEIETISTGSLGLDIALGVGGLPRGRVIEIFGPESSGKTTLTLHCVAEAQRNGGTAASSTPNTRSTQSTRNARRQSRQSSTLPARHRRASARNRRHVGPLERDRRTRRRFRRRFVATGRNRR